MRTDGSIASSLYVKESGTSTTGWVANAGAAAQLSQQTANYTLVLADAGKVIEMNSASARTVTVPTNTSVAFPVGTTIEVVRYGAGTVTLTPADGTVTLQTPSGGLAITATYGTATLFKRGTNEWIVGGLV